MEKRDYLIREIEKIGLMLNMLINGFRKEGEVQQAFVENPFEDIHKTLLSEAGFDMPLFISMDNKACGEYLSRFAGLNGINLELLADLLKGMGETLSPPANLHYLQKSVLIYEMCIRNDKTFSIERDIKINQIKEVLKNNNQPD
ncbi:MAG: hypothetical protein H6538_01800 [Bacteroidales bacterium]|nr:hypothetical protein [Bacteroidales bacterium]MCB9013132.1 hypothetical protein [Bacteroidales bacterium]